MFPERQYNIYAFSRLSTVQEHETPYLSQIFCVNDSVPNSQQGTSKSERSQSHCVGHSCPMGQGSAVLDPPWFPLGRRILEGSKDISDDLPAQWKNSFSLLVRLCGSNRNTKGASPWGPPSPSARWRYSSFQAAIRKELNEFKSTEMEVHELSRHLTRLVPRDFCLFVLPNE
jgi:hypothetical protein